MRFSYCWHVYKLNLGEISCKWRQKRHRKTVLTWKFCASLRGIGAIDTDFTQLFTTNTRMEHKNQWKKTQTDYKTIGFPCPYTLFEWFSSRKRVGSGGFSRIQKGYAAQIDHNSGGVPAPLPPNSGQFTPFTPRFCRVLEGLCAREVGVGGLGDLTASETRLESVRGTSSLRLTRASWKRLCIASKFSDTFSCYQTNSR